MTLVAGVDSSTQSCTVVLHDESGTMLASASAPCVDYAQSATGS